MVPTIKTLMEKGQYQEALQLALEALMARDNDLQTLVQINIAIARCRVELGDPLAAVPSAQLAAKVARDIHLYDETAEAEIWKGVAYGQCGRYDDAIAAFYTVLELGQELQRRTWWEYLSWWNLGCIYERTNRPVDQLWALKQAWNQSWVLESAAQRNSLRTMLVNAYLTLGDFKNARNELEGLRKYLETNSGDLIAQHFYLVDLSRLAFERKKYRFASHLALEGIERVKGQPLRQFIFYRRLYESCVRLGRFEDALGYALVARMAAIEARKYDVEYEAAEWVVNLIRDHGSQLVARLDAKYQLQGVNLGDFLGGQVWRS